MLLVVSLLVLILADASLAGPPFSLPAVNDANQQGIKTVSIKGIAKYKPGGSMMLLSLLVEGQPGIMPGGGGGSQPTASPGATTSPGATGGATGGATSGATGGATSVPTGSPSSASSTSSPTGGSPGSTGGGGGYQGNAMEKEGLELHNKFRKVHNSQPMKLNKKLCEEAEAYAKVIAQSGNMKHSSKQERQGQGENLSMGCSSKKAQTVTEAVTNWYNEVCNPGYQFGAGRHQGGTGHFTQVVWDDSVELGIGRAESTEQGMKCAYIVGRYKPLGNFDTGNDDYNKNVKKGSFDRQSYCSTIKSSRGGFKKSLTDLRRIIDEKPLKRKLGSNGHKQE